MQEFPWVESGDTCSLGNGLLIFRILKFTLKIFPLQILNLVGQGYLALLVCIWGSPRCNDCSPPPPACSFLVNSLRIKPPFIAFRGWGGPILAINKYLDWWGRLLLYFLASLRNTYQHSFVGCLLKSRPRRICQECATKSSLWANSPIWASEASLARTRERGPLFLLVRSRETRFTRPNRRACSRAKRKDHLKLASSIGGRIKTWKHSEIAHV